MRDGVECKLGCIVTGEERHLQSFAHDVGSHPLRILLSAQSALVEEALLGRDLQPIERAGPRGVRVRVEDRGDFCRLQAADGGKRKRFEVDGDL